MPMPMPVPSKGEARGKGDRVEQAVPEREDFRNYKGLPLDNLAACSLLACWYMLRGLCTTFLEDSFWGPQPLRRR
jgi:hypothetical protein